MSWQERIRARLRQETSGEQAGRCAELLEAILAGQERGAVADAIRQRLQVIEDAFDAQLRQLEEKL